MPAVYGAVVMGNLARPVDPIILNVIAAIAAVAQVDGMMGHIVDVVVRYAIPIAETQEYSCGIGINKSDVMNSIVGDLVENRMRYALGAADFLVKTVPPACQHNSVCSGMADFIAADQVSFIMGRCTPKFEPPEVLYRISQVGLK